MINFDVQQALDEGLGDMHIAENKPEHNRIGNVEFIEGLYCHLYSHINVLGALMYTSFFSKKTSLKIFQTTVCKNAHFFNSCLQGI